ncbi:MAG: amidohydrolase family protein [Woeseiaceae bacterium]|nr:amidohydrolase family protein [Woeseiaceae bacterium]
MFEDGAIAIRGADIAAVGPTREIDEQFTATTRVDGSRFVVTPGCIDGHIHVTGDPLTRGYMPDNVSEKFNDKLTKWVLPRYLSHTPDDERLSAQLAGLEMLRSGTTCFAEAGTIRYLDEVVDGMSSTGIRGRVGIWVEGRAYNKPAEQASRSADAIALLEDEVQRFPAAADIRISAWPILVGHSTNSDDVWQAAKRIADQRGLAVSAHMSARQSDPDWFIEHTGRRPVEHLDHLGVLGSNLCLTHMVRIDEAELALLEASGTNVILCPLASIKGAFGVSRSGHHAEMVERGINLLLGSDGYNADMWRLLPLLSGLFKDSREDITLMPAWQTLELVTVNAAKALQMSRSIGSLEAGKKADLVCHDTWRPEWMPVMNVVNQLVWSADGRSVHSVWVDGVRVIDDYRSTQLDEDDLYARAQAAGDAVIRRSELPFVCPWPFVI